ncbi:LysM peptidoglycan-binding domain-containing protein [Luteolibacter sp. Populi]|uniref:LysM peptidoglycan-binding domain-containing protein n=1 Tax=Luteolibacter sp. Populi TaxID=3230487 RepID=UPI003465E461
MQVRWFCLPAALLSVVATSCKSTDSGVGGTSSITGPFDARGNYVEAWADNPSKWRKGSAEIVEAQPDRPAADVPVVPPAIIAANATPKPISTTTRTIIRKPTPTTVSNSKTKPKSSSTASSSKSKSKPVVVKPKTTPKKQVVKVKPKANRYTVKAGDNLNAIAKRHGTTASAVQRANGLKSTNSIIRPGQSLTIPK